MKTWWIENLKDVFWRQTLKYHSFWGVIKILGSYSKVWYFRTANFNWCATRIFIFFPLFKKNFVIQLQLSAFSPHPSTPPQTIPPPSHTSTLPLDFVHVSFIVVPVNPSPHCPLSPLPSGYCYIVLNFSVSGYILFAFFFCWLCSS